MYVTPLEFVLASSHTNAPLITSEEIWLLGKPVGVHHIVIRFRHRKRFPYVLMNMTVCTMASCPEVLTRADGFVCMQSIATMTR